MQTIRVNLDNGAATQYSGYGFNSMCVFNGVIIAAGDDGLFRACCGDSDNGTAIDAYFVTSLTNLGSTNKKRVSKVYLGFECDGDMTVTITGDEKTTSPAYTLDAELSEGQQRRRCSTGKGMKWHYGSFRFDNVDGADFSVDHAQATVLFLSHGEK
jgi:hypothetical protein